MAHFTKIFFKVPKVTIFSKIFWQKIKAEKLLLILLTQSKPETKQLAIRSVQFGGIDPTFLSKLPEKLVQFLSWPWLVYWRNVINTAVGACSMHPGHILEILHLLSKYLVSFYQVFDCLDIFGNGLRLVLLPKAFTLIKLFYNFRNPSPNRMRIVLDILKV